MIDYININICEVEEHKLLKSNQFRTVYLINNKLVVMFSANAKVIFNWYMDNQNFAPATIYGTDECICYDYLVPSSEYVKKFHLLDFIRNFRPKLVSISDSEYYDALEGKYRTHCSNLGINPQILIRPEKEGLYQLHGNVDFDHTLVFDGKVILLDPRPITGAILVDIMSMYLSSFEVLKMFDKAEIAKTLNVKITDVEYYYEIILLSKLNKIVNKDPKLYQQYLSLLSINE